MINFYIILLRFKKKPKKPPTKTKPTKQPPPKKPHKTKKQINNNKKKSKPRNQKYNCKVFLYYDNIFVPEWIFIFLTCIGVWITSVLNFGMVGLL